MNFNLCIQCNPDAYNKLRETIKTNGVAVYGHKSRIRHINQAVFEWAVYNIPEEKLLQIIKEQKDETKN